VRFRLVPTDRKFFELFCNSAANAAQCARALQSLVSDLDGLADHLEVIMAYERKGDEVTRAILQRLNSSFVTPFDREDIHALAEELDDVCDDILHVAAMLNVVHPQQLLPEVKEQADVLVQMADVTVELMGQLESMKGTEPLLDAIDRLETEGDRVYRRALGRLFSGEYPALEVLKWKDVVDATEAGLNTIEDISSVVESIVLKFA